MEPVGVFLASGSKAVSTLRFATALQRTADSGVAAVRSALCASAVFFRPEVDPILFGHRCQDRARVRQARFGARVRESSRSAP